jgi:hypothetical protein
VRFMRWLAWSLATMLASRTQVVTEKQTNRTNGLWPRVTILYYHLFSGRRQTGQWIGHLKTSGAKRATMGAIVRRRSQWRSRCAMGDADHGGVDFRYPGHR